MRQENQVGIELCYEYYTDTCDNPIAKNFEEFVHVFQPFIHTMRPDFTDMLQKYDVQFNINILRDKEGIIIKIY